MTFFVRQGRQIVLLPHCLTINACQDTLLQVLFWPEVEKSICEKV